jgi:hypothetical protein
MLSHQGDDDARVDAAGEQRAEWNVGAPGTKAKPQDAPVPDGQVAGPKMLPVPTAIRSTFRSVVLDPTLVAWQVMSSPAIGCLHSSRPSCSGCPAKLTFTDYHAIPTFSLVDAPSLSRVAATASTAVWLLFLAVGVSLASVGRISRWAIQS